MLAVAIDGPWLKLAEAVDYVRAVASAGRRADPRGRDHRPGEVRRHAGRVQPRRRRDAARARARRPSSENRALTRQCSTSQWCDPGCTTVDGAVGQVHLGRRAAGHLRRRARSPLVESPRRPRSGRTGLSCRRLDARSARRRASAAPGTCGSRATSARSPATWRCRNEIDRALAVVVERLVRRRRRRRRRSTAPRPSWRRGRSSSARTARCPGAAARTPRRRDPRRRGSGSSSPVERKPVPRWPPASATSATRRRRRRLAARPATSPKASARTCAAWVRTSSEPSGATNSACQARRAPAAELVVARDRRRARRRAARRSRASVARRPVQVGGGHLGLVGRREGPEVADLGVGLEPLAPVEAGVPQVLLVRRPAPGRAPRAAGCRPAAACARRVVDPGRSRTPSVSRSSDSSP